jgi:hypothetical protein
MSTGSLSRSLAAGALLLLTACGGNTANGAGNAPTPGGPITVRVTNNAPSDMDIYAVSTVGYADWVGMVPGISSQTLSLPASDAWGGTLRVVAHPIAGRGVARSDPLFVAPGDQIRFTVQEPLGTSYATTGR